MGRWLKADTQAAAGEAVGAVSTLLSAAMATGLGAVFPTALPLLALGTQALATACALAKLHANPPPEAWTLAPDVRPRSPGDELEGRFADTVALAVWWAHVGALDELALAAGLTGELGPVGAVAAPLHLADLGDRADYTAAAWDHPSTRGLRLGYRVLLGAAWDARVELAAEARFAAQLRALVGAQHDLYRAVHDRAASAAHRRRFPLVLPPLARDARVDLASVQRFPSVDLARHGAYATRTDERRLLNRARPDEACTRVILLSGGPGAGKTALLYGLGVRLAGEGWPVRRADAGAGIEDLEALFDGSARPRVVLVDEVSRHEELWRWLLHEAEFGGTTVIGTARTDQSVERQARSGVEFLEFSLGPPDAREVGAFAERVGLPAPTGRPPPSMMHLTWAFGGATFEQAVRMNLDQASAALHQAVALAALAADHDLPVPFDLLHAAVSRRHRLDLDVRPGPGGGLRFGGAEAAHAGRLLRPLPLSGEAVGVTVALDGMSPVILSALRPGAVEPSVLWDTARPETPEHRDFGLALAARVLDAPTDPTEEAAAEGAMRRLLVHVPAIEVVERLWPVGAPISAAAHVAAALRARPADEDLVDALARWMEVFEVDPSRSPVLLREVAGQLGESDPAGLLRLLVLLTSRPALRHGRMGASQVAPFLADRLLAGEEHRRFVHFLTYYVQPGVDLPPGIARAVAAWGLARSTGPGARADAYMLALRTMADPEGPLDEGLVTTFSNTLGRPDTHEHAARRELEVIRRLPAAHQEPLIARWLAIGERSRVAPRTWRERLLDRRTSAPGIYPYRTPRTPFSEVELQNAIESVQRALRARNVPRLADALKALGAFRPVEPMRWAFAEVLRAVDSFPAGPAALRRPLVHLAFHRANSERFYGLDARGITRDLLTLYDWLGDPSAWGDSLGARDRARWCVVLRQVGKVDDAEGLARRALGRIESQGRPPHEENAYRDLVLQLARNAMVRGDQQGSLRLARGVVALARDAVRRVPDTPPGTLGFAWMSVAQALRGPHFAAPDEVMPAILQALGDAVRSKATETGPYNLEIEIHLARGEATVAEGVLRRMLAANPSAFDNPASFRWLPRVAAALGDATEAGRAAEEFLERTRLTGAPGALWSEMEAYARGDLDAWARHRHTPAGDDTA